MLENLEFYRKTFPNWTENKLKKILTQRLEKTKNIKSGSDVIHLDYYSNLLEKNEIEEIEKLLNSVNLKLSYFDKLGEPTACLNEFVLDSFVFLNSTITQNLLIGLGTNAIWDCIKVIILKLNKSIKNKPNEINKNEVKFGITMSLGKNKQFDFRLDSNISEDTLLKIIDKTLDFLNTQNQKPNNYNRFTKYNKEKEAWEFVDINIEIDKKIKKNGKI